MERQGRPADLEVAGGRVNLLRDLDVLQEIKDSRRREAPRKGTRDKVGMHGNLPTPSDLRDPELYSALMQECVREESSKNYVAPPLITNYLIRNDIRPLKKRSQKFPKAQYYCRLCDYHCDTLTICISHIKDDRHSRLARMQEVETTLYHLPKPNRQHLDYLDNLLARTQSELGLTPQDIQDRMDVAALLGDVLKPVIPGCRVRLYGSCFSGFGLKSSALNLDLQIPESSTPHLALVAAAEALLANSLFSSVTRNFSAKIPMILFSIQDFDCELSLSNEHAYMTSLLLRDYYLLDQRVQTLAVAIRLWASLCKVDRPAEGTLPAHSFSLLLVFFLQQESKPVLPCLHDSLKSRNPETYSTPEAAMRSWKTSNSMTAAELLVEFFEFYAIGFRAAEYVVSIRSIGGFTKEEKQWKGKKLTIEDPFSPKRSLTRSITSMSSLDYITDCFKIAYLYFGTIQTSLGPVVTKILVPDASPERKSSVAEEASESVTNGDVSDLLHKLNLSHEGHMASVPKDKVLTLEELEQSFQEIKEAEEREPEESRETLESFVEKYGRELTPKQAKRVIELVPKDMILFRFDADILTAGRTLPLFCSVCGTEGHLQSDCPMEKMPPLRPLPAFAPGDLQTLDQVCLAVMANAKPKETELNERKSFVVELTKFIKQSFPNAHLTVFGSSHNGFAFANSDLDLSLTFSDHETDADVDAIDVIERLAERLKHMKSMRNVQAITSAKVPIIKFLSFQNRSKIEGDISLYNILAQENTKMLRYYSCIDERVKILGYMVKLLAKVCDIGDASRGSLSSYAYILMLIHFLQQRNPPVIPVLQELHPPGDRPVRMVDGWNAWFFDDPISLEQAWPNGLGRNCESAAQLWLGFLEYYAADFNDRELVVCIRQLKPLSKFEKMWNSPCIAIEDPFELSHNLGAGISRKMNIFIKKAFMRTRDHFAFPPRGPIHHKSLQDYLWDPEYLTDGPPPNDRGCRACGKIGHLVRECPRKKASEDRKKEALKHRNKQQQKAPKVAPAGQQPQQGDERRPEQQQLHQTGGGTTGRDFSSLLESVGAVRAPVPASAISLSELERRLVHQSPPALAPSPLCRFVAPQQYNGGPVPPPGFMGMIPFQGQMPYPGPFVPGLNQQVSVPFGLSQIAPIQQPVQPNISHTPMNLPNQAMPHPRTQHNVHFHQPPGATIERKKVLSPRNSCLAM